MTNDYTQQAPWAEFVEPAVAEVTNARERMKKEAREIAITMVNAFHECYVEHSLELSLAEALRCMSDSFECPQMMEAIINAMEMENRE